MADLDADPGRLTPELVLAVLPGTGIERVCADAVGCDTVDRVGNGDALFSSETFTEFFVCGRIPLSNPAANR